MFDQKTVQDIEIVAREFGIDVAALAAIAEIESGGRTHAMVEGKAEPLIRFEGHYFDRRLSGKPREKARLEKLASPIAGEIRNPSSQAGRWKLLKRATNINSVAAYESTSWGLGQVMGAHWEWLGFESIEAMVQEARSGVQGQLRLMALFIQKSNLVPVLQRKDWAGFARAYNGPAYRRNKYDAKLAKAYSSYAGRKNKLPVKALRFGMKGEAVRLLQEELVRHGYPLVMDGAFGLQTRQAVQNFQQARKLNVDGIAGPSTLAALKMTTPQIKMKRADWKTRLSFWFERLFGVKA